MSPRHLLHLLAHTPCRATRKDKAGAPTRPKVQRSARCPVSESFRLPAESRAACSVGTARCCCPRHGHSPSVLCASHRPHARAPRGRPRRFAIAPLRRAPLSLHASGPGLARTWQPRGGRRWAQQAPAGAQMRTRPGHGAVLRAVLPVIAPTPPPGCRQGPSAWVRQSKLSVCGGLSGGFLKIKQVLFTAGPAPGRRSGGQAAAPGRRAAAP